MASSFDAEDRWRALAAEARVMAEVMVDSQARRIMLSIASAYDRLAERARMRKDGAEKP